MTNFAANFAYIMNIGDYNSLFTELNSSNSSLTINKVYLSSILELDNVSPMYLQNEDIEPLGFETCGKKSLGYRLIEVAAFSLFKSATARAALANKTQYYNGSSEEFSDFSNAIADSLNTSFAADSNSIYNQYGFNFSGINFAVNYYHTGYTMGINRGHSYYGPIAGFVNSFNHTLLLLLTEDF